MSIKGSPLSLTLSDRLVAVVIEAHPSILRLVREYFRIQHNVVKNTRNAVATVRGNFSWVVRALRVDIVHVYLSRYWLHGD